MEHELKYRAASLGLAPYLKDVPEPHWYCTCGEWVKRRTGNGRPMRPTAEKLHAAHVQSCADGE